MRAIATAAAFLVAASAAATELEPRPAEIPSGRHRLLFGMTAGAADVPVAAFRIDRALVTNADFQRFLAKAPRWRNPPSLFAEARYLAHWREGAPPPGYKGAPVVFVSWFAARAYCQSRGGRLPTTLEWEYVAAADEDRAEASRDPRFVARILGWYARPSRPEDLLRPEAGPPNLWGVRQLHQYVWEWTEDFGALFLTGDNRQDGDAPTGLFCGAGSAAGADREDYAAFMRFALRGSLEGRFTLGNLGFRCAYDEGVAP